MVVRCIDSAVAVEGRISDSFGEGSLGSTGLSSPDPLASKSSLVWRSGVSSVDSWTVELRTGSLETSETAVEEPGGDVASVSSPWVIGSDSRIVVPGS